MTNGRIDDAQIQLMLTGIPEGPERDRASYMLTTLQELTTQMASVAQHCRYCNASTDTSESDDKRVWALWGVGRVVLEIVSPVAATLITLAVTGQLGG